MNNVTRLVITTLLGIDILSTVATANTNKGKKLYIQKLKVACGFNGAKFARAHTQDEWEAIKQAGKFSKEIKSICPKSTLKSKDENDIYDFAYVYAKGSGNIPTY